MTLGIGYFIGILRDECPCTDDAQSGCDLPECSYSLSNYDLCEAERTLPDGNSNFDINNCPGDYDVFRYVSGKLSFINMIPTPNITITSVMVFEMELVLIIKISKFSRAHLL